MALLPQACTSTAPGCACGAGLGELKRWRKVNKNMGLMVMNGDLYGFDDAFMDVSWGFDGDVLLIHGFDGDEKELCAICW